MAEEPQAHSVDYVALDTWHVVLDTNEMFGDFRLRNRVVRFLLENARPPRFHLCVPEVVIREMANHFREHWSAALQKYEAAQRELEGLIGRAISDKVGSDELRAAADRYETDLRQGLLGYGVHIEPIPAELAGVEKLLQRDLDRRKPFGDRGVTDKEDNRRDRGGMRDALIWESVLALCHREPRALAFISDNVGDFAEASRSQPPRLHPHLLQDLGRVGLTHDMVSFYKSVREFNLSHLGSATRHQDYDRSVEFDGEATGDQDSVGPTDAEA
jgi:hypothetical protein